MIRKETGEIVSEIFRLKMLGINSKAIEERILETSNISHALENAIDKSLNGDKPKIPLLDPKDK